MKIGILTYHRSHNYGALLQAIALRHTIGKMGHDVYFVDYWPDYHADMYRLVSRHRLRVGSLPGRVRYLIRSLLTRRKTLRRIECFNRFIERNIAPYCLPVDCRYDAVVYGSDQIWRRQDALDGRFNPIYFGVGINASLHLAYAASMGQIRIDDASREKIREWLSAFGGIAVRESELRDTLASAGVKDVEQVLDPTLLLDADEWRELIRVAPKTEGYVLFYDLMPDSFDEEAIRRFAAEKGLPLKILKGRVEKARTVDNVLDCEDPAGMVNLIANADYVFTSSYHGLIFSLIFEKEVTAAFHHNRGRAESLLGALGLSDRLLSGKNSGFPESRIDYSDVARRMKEYRASSLEYLDRHLGTDKLIDNLEGEQHNP